MTDEQKMDDLKRENVNLEQEVRELKAWQDEATTKLVDAGKLAAFLMQGREAAFLAGRSKMSWKDFLKDEGFVYDQIQLQQDDLWDDVRILFGGTDLRYLKELKKRYTIIRNT